MDAGRPFFVLSFVSMIVLRKEKGGTSVEGLEGGMQAGAYVDERG